MKNPKRFDSLYVDYVPPLAKHRESFSYGRERIGKLIVLVNIKARVVFI